MTNGAFKYNPNRKFNTLNNSKIIAFNNDYIAQINMSEENLSAQIVQSIQHEVEKDPKCESICYTYWHNPMFLDIFYEQEFRKLDDRKTYLDILLRNSAMREIKIAYRNDAGNLPVKIIWLRDHGQPVQM